MSRSARRLGRLLPAALFALALFLPGLAAGQDAPPHEGEVPASPFQGASPPQKASQPKKPAAAPQKPGAAPAKPVNQTKPPMTQAKPYLRSLDGNHDGRVSREEFLAGSKKRFAKADTNHDGVVSAQEAKAAKARMLEQQAKRDAKRQAKGLPVKPRKAKGDKPPKPYLSTFDKNQDGRVSQKEYLARREKKFGEMDLNHDGVVSREEAKIAKKKLLERRAERKAQARERRLDRIGAAKARQTAPGTLSSPGPELIAPAAPAPPPLAPSMQPKQQPDQPLTPITPDLPAAPTPET